VGALDTFERRTPHYLRIYRDLKEKITGGTFAPGERLPTQRDLAGSHGVTVMTVRQALQLLEQEELVVSRHGLGTFVAPQRIRYEVGNLRSLAQEVAAQGLVLRTRVLGRGLVEPHPHVAELLHVEPGEPVLSIERLRFVGLEPVVYQQSYLQSRFASALAEVDLSALSLYNHIQSELGVELSRAQERIHAIGLAGAEADLLEQQPGAAALLSERITFSVASEPIMFDRAFMPGNRVSVATERFVTDISVGYELRLAEEEA
jgi:GntR family transcriptional regulator